MGLLVPQREIVGLNFEGVENPKTKADLPLAGQLIIQIRVSSWNVEFRTPRAAHTLCGKFCTAP